MKIRKKLLGLGAVAGLVASIMAAPIANADQLPETGVVYKTCYLTLPSTWVIKNNADVSENRFEYGNVGSYLSGDCPSTTELAVGKNPWNDSNRIFYESGGVQVGYSGMSWAVDWNGMRFPGLQAPYDDWDSMNLYAVESGIDANGFQLREVRWVNYAVTDWWSALGKTWTPRPAEYYEHVWTGNDATEPCDYESAEVCPGGWKYDNYKFVTVNPLVFKFASPFDATAKKKGSSLTFKVSQNRSSVMGVYDESGNQVRSFSEDSVQVFRNGKLIKSKSFTKMGKSKITVKDKRGKQTYTVCIAETQRTWSECKTFIK